MRKKSLFVVFFAVLMAACGHKHTPQSVAERFLSGYLDCRFSDVAADASPEVQERMRWRASQLTEADVALLAGQDSPARVTTVGVEEYGDSAVVRLSATDALLLDSIDQPAHIGEAHYRLTLKREKGRNWVVTALFTIYSTSHS